MRIRNRLIALIIWLLIPFFKVVAGNIAGVTAIQSPNADSLALLYNTVDAANFPHIVSLVTVTNAAGFIVGSLDENNFEVYEDGTRELPIQVEELTVSEFGINVVLAIDRSGSMRGQPIADAKTAATTFVEIMQEQDKSAIVSFSHEPRTDYPFSNDQDSLKAAIARIQANGGTAIYDALMHSVYLMSSDLKNRAIILLTDGADRDSHYSFEEAVIALLSHEVRVFTIGLGLNPDSPEENILKALADTTGGLYYYSPTSSDLEEIYRAISRLLHHRYRVSYNTHNPAKDGTLRHVRIKVLVNSNTSSDTASYRAPYENTNGLPAALNLAINPPDPLTMDNLTGSYSYSDPDGDAEGFTEIRWYKDNAEQATFNNALFVPYMATTKGEQWYFTVRPHDGKEYGNLATSPVVVIGNTPPEAANAIISPANPLTTDDLVGSYEYSDVDDDAESGTEVRWYKNGALQAAFNNQLNIPAAATAVGEQWYFTVLPSDGTDFGELQTSNTVTIDELNTEPPSDTTVVEPVFEVVPNPFTPNDDGYNDRAEFRKGEEIPQEWVITILDRSGRLIKRLRNGNRYWNGRDEAGNLMLPGSYLYLVSDGKQVLHRGLIQLIR